LRATNKTGIGAASVRALLFDNVVCAGSAAQQRKRQERVEHLQRSPQCSAIAGVTRRRRA
jgi:hypothetical protein